MKILKYSDIEEFINSLDWSEDDKKYLIDEIGNLPDFILPMKSSYE